MAWKSEIGYGVFHLSGTGSYSILLSSEQKLLLFSDLHELIWGLSKVSVVKCPHNRKLGSWDQLAPLQ